MDDWATVASLATAGGTLILAVATYASVRSANRAARVAERALLVGLRPVLVQSRFEDRSEKIGFADARWVQVNGAGAAVEIGDDGVVYLVMSLRNVGSGIGVLHGWDVRLEDLANLPDPSPPEQFRRQGRDLYIPPGDVGLWQGAVREADDPLQGALAERAATRERFAIDLLYGDHEGGQRAITRFGVFPRGDEGWLCSAVRHWNLDRDDPR